VCFPICNFIVSRVYINHISIGYVHALTSIQKNMCIDNRRHTLCKSCVFQHTRSRIHTYKRHVHWWWNLVHHNTYTYNTHSHTHIAPIVVTEVHEHTLALSLHVRSLTRSLSAHLRAKYTDQHTLTLIVLSFSRTRSFSCTHARALSSSLVFCLFIPLPFVVFISRSHTLFLCYYVGGVNSRLARALSLSLTRTHADTHLYCHIHSLYTHYDVGKSRRARAHSHLSI